METESVKFYPNRGMMAILGIIIPDYESKIVI